MIRDCTDLVTHIASELHEYVDIAVVGLSSGADSSLTATLCAEALGKDNVYGISMPYSDFDARTFNSASEALAKRIGIQHLIRPVGEIAAAIDKQIASDTEVPATAINKGNSRSRARMCVLYGTAHDLAHRHADKRLRVIGTGNLSEDFIGYDTKGGDALADIFPIGDLFKSEVYQLLEYFRDRQVIDEENINRIPSAGLEDGQTDEGDLGYSYNEMEKGVRLCLENYDSMPVEGMDEIAKFVWSRHCQHKHKHEAPAVLTLRPHCD